MPWRVLDSPESRNATQGVSQTIQPRNEWNVLNGSPRTYGTLEVTGRLAWNWKTGEFWELSIPRVWRR